PRSQRPRSSLHHAVRPVDVFQDAAHRDQIKTLGCDLRMRQGPYQHGQVVMPADLGGSVLAEVHARHFPADLLHPVGIPTRTATKVQHLPLTLEWQRRLRTTTPAQPGTEHCCQDLHRPALHRGGTSVAVPEYQLVQGTARPAPPAAARLWWLITAVLLRIKPADPVLHR